MRARAKWDLRSIGYGLLTFYIPHHTPYGHIPSGSLRCPRRNRRPRFSHGYSVLPYILVSSSLCSLFLLVRPHIEISDIRQPTIRIIRGHGGACPPCPTSFLLSRIPSSMSRVVSLLVGETRDEDSETLFGLTRRAHLGCRVKYS